jgi:hypothetical protein
MREMRQMWTGGCNECGLDGVQQMQVECAANATTPGCNKCDNGCNECGQGGCNECGNECDDDSDGCNGCGWQRMPENGGARFVPRGRGVWVTQVQIGGGRECYAGLITC